jgi:hypothetical protein
MEVTRGRGGHTREMGNTREGERRSYKGGGVTRGRGGHTRERSHEGEEVL